jgi:hypothetical protein
MSVSHIASHFYAISQRLSHCLRDSQPIASKDSRTQFHQAIRELFGGKLDSETDTTPATDQGSRIVVKWSHRGGRGGGRGGAGRGGKGQLRLSLTLQSAHSISLS